MMDVKGPEIRTGRLEDAIPVKAGDLFEFHVEGAAPSGSARRTMPTCVARS